MTPAECHSGREDVGGGLCADCALAELQDLIDEEDDPQTKACTSCGEVRMLRDFHKGKAICKRCVLLREYGLTHAGYDILLEEQDRGCAICGVSADDIVLAVDHDHTSGAVRGLLCGPCNQALGLLGDDEMTVRRAADYLNSPPAARSVDFNLGGCGCVPGRPDWSLGQVMPQAHREQMRVHDE